MTLCKVMWNRLDHYNMPKLRILVMDGQTCEWKMCRPTLIINYKKTEGVEQLPLYSFNIKSKDLLC